MRRPFDWRAYIARTAVRRVVYIIVGLIVTAAITWATPAHAAQCGVLSKSEAGAAAGVGQTDATQAEAGARCASVQRWHGPPSAGNYPVYERISCDVTSTGVVTARGRRVQTLLPDCTANSSTFGTDSISPFRFTQACPENSPWDPETGTCKPPNNCATAPNVAAGASSGGAPICVNGCTYVPDSSAGTTVGYDGPNGDSIFSAANSWKPNGVECSAENHPMPWDPAKPTCQTVPGSSFNHCTQPDGRNCVTTAQGRRLCWGGTETGPRMTSDGKEGANRQPPGTPAPPPQGMENPQAAGTVHNTTNNYSTSTTVYNGGGNRGGQGNVGEGGKDTSNGSGEGEGEGDGKENSVSGGLECSAPPSGCTGDQHTCNLIMQTWRNRCEGQAEAGTIGGKLGQFEGGLNDGDEGPGQGDIEGVFDADPFAGAKVVQDGASVLDRLDASGFLGAGSCPQLDSVTVGRATFPLTLGPMCQLLASMSYLVMALAYFLAFRIVAGGS